MEPKQGKKDAEVKAERPYENDEFYEPLYDEHGRPYPPAEAIYDYYDENYYYELVETKPVDTAALLLEPDVYIQRQKRKNILSDL